MSRIAKGIFGAAAVSLAVGAVQFASGRDLAGALRASAGTPEIIVNRSAKADRTGAFVAAAAPTRTVALRLHSLAETSLLIRLPVAKTVEKKPAEKDARNGPAPSVTKSGKPRPTVACEPVVSTLTEVAKLLQPGRCVT